MFDIDEYIERFKRDRKERLEDEERVEKKKEKLKSYGFNKLRGIASERHLDDELAKQSHKAWKKKAKELTEE